MICDASRLMLGNAFEMTSIQVMLSTELKENLTPSRLCNQICFIYCWRPLNLTLLLELMRFISFLTKLHTKSMHASQKIASISNYFVIFLKSQIYSCMCFVTVKKKKEVVSKIVLIKTEQEWQQARNCSVRHSYILRL